MQRIQLERARTYRNQRRLEDGKESSEITLSNQQDMTYLASISVDNNDYKVIIDTGSSDLWISCSYYKGADCADIPSSSTTCPSDLTSIQYTGGLVCVQPSTADVDLGHLDLNDYVIGIASGDNVEKGSKTTIIGDGVEGLLGLSYDPLSAIPRTKGKIVIDRVNSFSIYMNSYEDNDEKESFLLFNGVDEDLIKHENLKPHSLPIAEYYRWSVGLTAFQAGNSDVKNMPCNGDSIVEGYGCLAIVDTGTSAIVAPSHIYQELQTKYFSRCQYQGSPSQGIPYCPASIDLPRLAFTMGDKTFYLEPKDYSLSYAGYNVVLISPSTSPQPSQQHWVLGAAFMRRFYWNFEVDKSIVIYCNEEDGGSCGTPTKDTTTASGSDWTPGIGSDSNPYANGNGYSPFAPIIPDGSNSQTGFPFTTGTSGISSSTKLFIIIGAVAGFLAFLVLCGICGSIRKRRTRGQMSQQVYYVNTTPQTSTPPYARYQV